ncbi:MAG TPA: peptidylprolyl isomerase [Thermomicrobiales bacterium]|nr:peptidylprolyl isomerase [Thermomicrobiales bacterium]
MLNTIRHLLRRLAGQDVSPRGVPRQRHVSRRERELRQRRILYAFTALAGAVVILALVVGASYQYYFLPRQTLASVNGEDIQRRDYWMVRELVLRQNIAQISQQLQFTPEGQREQLSQQIQAAQVELEDVEGAPINAETLAAMVDDRVVLRAIASLGLSVTDEEVDQFILEQFAPVPLTEPTPTATIEPTAAAWATETADVRVADATQTADAFATQAAQTPTPGLTPDAETTATVVEPPDPAGTPEPTGTSGATGTTDATGSPEATGSPDAAGTPAPSETQTPEVTPSPSPTATNTPSPDEARDTSEETFELFKENYLDPSGMSRGDYERLVIRPALAREKARIELTDAVATRMEQVRAQHILIQTREAADALMARLETEEFGDIAREVSMDTGTAGTGGDLGWFPRGLMVDEFEAVAFELGVGQTSEPVQSEFGWHIIRVLERDDDRPLTIATLRTLQNAAFENWVDEQRQAADVSSDTPLPGYIPDAETGLDAFQAPPDAPMPPAPTPLPLPTMPPVPVETPEINGTPGIEESPTP